MSGSPILMLIQADEETAKALAHEVSELPGSTARVSSRQNLDGAVMEWVVLVTATAQAVPQLLSLIHSRGRRLPTKIKLGDDEIENPSEADIAWLKERHSK